MTDSPYLGARATAAYLGIHINTLKRMTARELPWWEFGDRGDRRYARADIERYIEQRMVRP